jgi:SAM-dependent MidA family methyltransferase
MVRAQGLSDCNCTLKHDMCSALGQEIRDLIRKEGRITFAQFMQVCLYSPRGGFYSARSQRISAHFGTSSLSHPVFGVLIARQLEQMWRFLEEPRVFHVIEAGCGDGALAQSIVRACGRMQSGFTDALCYVAADYEPRLPQAADHIIDWDSVSATTDAPYEVQRVKTAGLSAFRNVVGCILSNELIDNFPVHRFVIRDGRVMEVFVTLDAGELAEILDEPSSPLIEERIASLGLSLPEGYRGEVNLGLEDWTDEIARALHRGFVLTIDYGQQASELYSSDRNEGTLVCYRGHAAGNDPYADVGQHDITCHVDFTTLSRLGERHGLATVGYVPQHRFLMNLGFAPLLDELDMKDLSAARRALSRVAMMALVDPDQYGDLKVLAQAKGIAPPVALQGLARETS